MTPLFPPRLVQGSHDKNPKSKKGPVYKLQTALCEFHPGLSAFLQLRPNGEFGKFTAILVAATQEAVNRTLEHSGGVTIPVTGMWDELTRTTCLRWLPEWTLDCESLEFVPGGECNYISEGFSELAPWPPADTVPEGRVEASVSA